MESINCLIEIEKKKIIGYEKTYYKPIISKIYRLFMLIEKLERNKQKIIQKNNEEINQIKQYRSKISEIRALVKEK